MDINVSIKNEQMLDISLKFIPYSFVFFTPETILWEVWLRR